MASRKSQPRLHLSESRARLLNLLFRLLEEECDANNANLPLGSLAANFRQGSAQLFTRDSLRKLQGSLVSKAPVLSANPLTGAAVFLANATVMFASRDWGGVGTVSAMAGGLIQVKPQ
jgi:hypothetical protein